jgi:hypothetical protein
MVVPISATIGTLGWRATLTYFRHVHIIISCDGIRSPDQAQLREVEILLEELIRSYSAWKLRLYGSPGFTVVSAKASLKLNQSKKKKN